MKKIIKITKGTEKKGYEIQKKNPIQKSRTPGQKNVVLGKKGQPGRPNRKPGAFNNRGS